MGRLSFQFYGLLEVGQHQGAVLLGTVDSVFEGGLQLNVERKWFEERGVFYPSGSPVMAKVGTRVRVELAQGVEWTDPNKSPIELRLAGYLPASELEVGAQVLIICDRTIDALPASSRNIEIVEMAFDPARLKRYLAGASEEQLTQDLCCPHLKDVAAVAMKQRGLFSAKVIISAFEDDTLRALLSDLFCRLDYRAKAAFVCEARDFFASADSQPWGNRLAIVCKQSSELFWECQDLKDAATWDALAWLASNLDPNHKRERKVMASIDFAMGSLATDSARKLSLAPFNRVMASFLLFEYSDTGSFAYYLTPRLDVMTAGEREDFLRCLSACIDDEKRKPRKRLRPLRPELYEIVAEAFESHRDPAIDQRLDALSRQLGILKV